MFLSQEAVDAVIKKLNIDPLKQYTSDELLNNYGKGMYLIHSSLHENYPKIYHLLERKETLIQYCIKAYATILQAQENAKSWWESIEEDFIYTFPRREFLDLDILEEGYATSLIHYNKELFSPAILEILSTVDMALWETLYNTAEAKNNPQMVIQNMKDFAYCFQEGIEIAETRQKEYNRMIKSGIHHDLAMEEADAYAYDLVQEQLKFFA